MAGRVGYLDLWRAAALGDHLGDGRSCFPCMIGGLAKPISLSCRLFGNVFGEDMLLVGFTSLGVATLAFVHSPIGVPWQLPFLVLALLTSTIQALVFTVLSTIYFLLMLPSDHGHEEAVHHAH
jgi:F0F1-type ATP synthase membrane subunit a